MGLLFFISLGMKWVCLFLYKIYLVSECTLLFKFETPLISYQRKEILIFDKDLFCRKRTFSLGVFHSILLIIK